MSDSDDFDFQSEDDEVVTAKKRKKNPSVSSPTPKIAIKKSKKVVESSDEECSIRSDDDDFDDDDIGSPKTATKKPKKATKASPSAPAAKPKAKASTVASVAAGSSAAVSVAPAAAAVSDAVIGASSSSSSSMDITRGPNVATEAGAKKLITMYLQQQNRPYSVIQVHDNLHKRIPKPTVERVLTALSQPEGGGGLRCKEYGKAKIYFTDQSTMKSNVSAVEMKALDDEAASLKQQLESSQAEEKKLRSQLAALQREPNDADLDRVLTEQEARNADKEKRVSSISGSKLPPNAVKDMVKAHNISRGHWRARKEACMDVVDVISEGLGKKTKDVTADMGIETDEDMRVAMPAALPER